MKTTTITCDICGNETVPRLNGAYFPDFTTHVLAVDHINQKEYCIEIEVQIRRHGEDNSFNGETHIEMDICRICQKVLIVNALGGNGKLKKVLDFSDKEEARMILINQLRKSGLK